ncbi:protein-glutamate O-methyltransferase CheR [Myxococcota bacterium]|nr:protein-glutamate O-methyltransferase CheR [Myxococcota bacterium]
MSVGLASDEFHAFSRIAYEKAGITLRPGKESMVAARIARRMRALGLDTPSAYRDYLEQDASGDELVAFLDAISTNVTSFFREEEHFEIVRKHVQGLVDAGRQRMRFWSAACSSGQEPYTLAMVLDRVLGRKVIDWRILGTDISTRVLEQAGRAEYDEREMEKVPEDYRASAFVRVKGANKPTWRVAEHLRAHMLFRRLSLSEPPFPMGGPMDVILCRNVMIYFDQTVRQGIVDEAERLLAPGGLFIISHTETLASCRTRLRLIRPSVARKEP